MERNPLSQDDVAEAMAQLGAIDWSRYETVYGSAEGVPALLSDLLTGDRTSAFTAVGKLWAALAHQRVHVPNAALPALPFLLLAMKRDEEGLEAEILDILWGFLVGGPFSPVPHGGETSDLAWFFTLHRGLREALRGFSPRTIGEDTHVIMDGIRQALSAPMPVP